jgi:hypothetical protein
VKVPQIETSNLTLALKPPEETRRAIDAMTVAQVSAKERSKRSQRGR